MLKQLFLCAALLASPNVVQAQVAELEKQGHPVDDYEKTEGKSTVFCLYDSERYSKGTVLPVDGNHTLICEDAIKMIKRVGEKPSLAWLDHAEWIAARQ